MRERVHGRPGVAAMLAKPEPAFHTLVFTSRLIRQPVGDATSDAVITAPARKKSSGSSMTPCAF